LWVPQCYLLVRSEDDSQDANSKYSPHLVESWLLDKVPSQSVNH
jgi:hypothetical protein